MTDSEEVLSLDVGDKRIGVARANTIARIAEPLETIMVDGNEINKITDIAKELAANKVVVGLPRNQQGEETGQSQKVRKFATLLSEQGLEVIWQDESVTSVLAEQKLSESGKSYKKEDVDMAAAVQILNDYLMS